MGKRKKRRLLVVDAMNLVFRAYYALISRPLRTTDGRNTSAIFGFARMLSKAIADYEPTHVAVALEGGGPSFREEIYPEYKATRKAPPEDLVAQLEPVKEFARLLGLAVIEKEGMEADDVVATLARGGAGPFDEVLILSGDKDLMALVGRGVKMLAPKTGVSDVEEMDEGAVAAKMGVAPAAVPDLLALEGDSVDNVPGVPGIGEKTARTLLENYGSLDEVFARVDELEPRSRKAGRRPSFRGSWSRLETTSSWAWTPRRSSPGAATRRDYAPFLRNMSSRRWRRRWGWRRRPRTS